MTETIMVHKNKDYFAISVKAIEALQHDFTALGLYALLMSYRDGLDEDDLCNKANISKKKFRECLKTIERLTGERFEILEN